VAPYHQRLFHFGSYVVDEVREGVGYDWRHSNSQFRVKLATKGMDDAAPVATFDVARVSQVLQFGNLLVLMRDVGDNANPWDHNGQSEALIYDLTDPTQPVVRGSVSIPRRVDSYPWIYCGVGWGYWPSYYGGSWVASEAGLGLLTYEYHQQGYDQVLLFVNLTNPDSPQLVRKTVATVTYDPNNGSVIGRENVSLVSDGTRLLLNFRERVGTFTLSDGTAFAKYKYFIQRLETDLSTTEAPVNVPGRVIRAWDTGGVIRYLSTDSRFTQRLQGTNLQWVPDTRVHLLKRTSPTTAVLLDNTTLEGQQLVDMVGEGDRLFFNLRPAYWSNWGFARPAGSASATTTEQPSDELVALDLSQDRLDRKFSGKVGTYGSQLMGLSQNRLFINLPGDGVLAVNVENLSAPVGQHFARTLGYATHVVFEGNIAFIASGNFGIYELDLASPVTLVRL
jgi:hypothetical protein